MFKSWYNHFQFNLLKYLFFFYYIFCNLINKSVPHQLSNMLNCFNILPCLKAMNAVDLFPIIIVKMKMAQIPFGLLMRDCCSRKRSHENRCVLHRTTTVYCSPSLSDGFGKGHWLVAMVTGMSCSVRVRYGNCYSCFAAL